MLSLIYVNESLANDLGFHFTNEASVAELIFLDDIKAIRFTYIDDDYIIT